MVNVLVTTAFDEARLDRLRRISPDLKVTRAEADTAHLRIGQTAECRYGKARERQFSEFASCIHRPLLLLSRGAHPRRMTVDAQFNVNAYNVSPAAITMY